MKREQTLMLNAHPQSNGRTDKQNNSENENGKENDERIL